MVGEGVTGTREAEALARRFKTAGSGGLKREMQQRLGGALAKLQPAIKNGALSSLPRSGGLAALVAGSRLDVSTAGGAARLTMSGSVHLAAINAGRLSHPVFGNSPNVTQSVTPGFFDKPVKQHERDIAHELETGMDEVARDILGHI